MSGADTTIVAAGASSTAPAGVRGLFDRSGLAGVIDGAVVLAYMGDADFANSAGSGLLVWYSATLAAKFVLLLTNLRGRGRLSGTATGFLAATAAMTLATLLAGAHSLSPYFPAGGFVAHLALSLMLIPQGRLRRYLAGALAPIVATTCVHIALVLTHRMPELWGRYFYFNYNAPNLGGEIEGAACLAAVLVLSRRLALATLAVLAIDMFFLQARSALLVAAAGAVVVVAFDARWRLSPGRAGALALLGSIGVLGLAVAGFGGRFSDTVSDLLLIHDQYRGVVSGASGRLELWNIAVQLFQESPIYGHSLDYFDDIGFIGAHNLVLSGLAQYGLSSIGYFTSLGYAYLKLYKSDRFRFVVGLMVLPLFMFNDRLINLNPYPFLVYVLLLAPIDEADRPAIRPPGEAHG